MWLDRFSNVSNASTPASNTPNRYHSPLPRKQSQLAQPQAQRNGLGIGLGRTNSNTSLDLVSPNSSTTSLPVLQRRQTGSALRQEQRPPPDIVNPVDALHEILGSDQSIQRESRNGKQEEGEVEVEFGGLSLEDFARQDLTTVSSDVTNPSLQTTALDRRKFEDFHASITEADAVLSSVESYLSSFKAELGQVSAEIESLQSRSVQLNTQLDNRRKVEKLLGPAVEEVSLSPQTVRAVSDGPIDDVFAKALTEIEARLLTAKERDNNGGQTKAVEDVKPLLDDLRNRAVERVRDYLVSQIKALRSPNVNAQVIQQQSFLRHKELYPFLTRVNPQLAEDIGKAYSNTMRWYYQSNFARYKAALVKMQLYAVDQSDLLGADPSTRKQNIIGGAKNAVPQYDPFSLGRRGDYLRSTDSRALPSHLAEDSKMVSHIEVPFRNFNQALLDNLSAEYSIVTELFSTTTFHQVSRRTTEIFEPTFAIGHNLTKTLIESTTDCLGILICIRLNQQYAFEAQKRKIPVMDDYNNLTNILLWPRFQKTMDMHIESLKRVPVANNRGAAAAFSLVGGSTNSASSLAPHAITQRFGQFLHGILSLSTNAGDDEPLAHSLGRLRGEYETLMGKLAKGVGDANKKSRFLFNNHSLVSTIISDTKGKLAEEQKVHFDSLVRDHKPR